MNPERPRLTIQSSLLCLLLVALIGVIMRGAALFDVLLPYEHWLHTHSHLAMLGWVYLALLAGIRRSFLRDLPSRSYRWLLGTTLFCVSGMAVSFPIQGYGSFSILFSCLFLLASYLLILFFLRQNGRRSRSLSGSFLRAALLYLFISSLGAWALGPIVAQGMKGEAIYRLAIYFYLHFQYNGWMSFALLGLLFRRMEDEGVRSDHKKARKGFWAVHIACIPAYALSSLWVGPGIAVFLLAGLAALLQLVALFYLFPSLRSIPRLLPQDWRWPFQLSLAVFALKLFMQALSALPYFAELLAYQRDLVIGYLHLVFLGFVSFGLFGYFLQNGWLTRSFLTRTGLLFFLMAFVLTEGLLFLRASMGLWMGTTLPFADELMFAGSLLFPVGVGLVWGKVR